MVMNKAVLPCGCTSWIDTDRTLQLRQCDDDDCPIMAAISRWLAVRAPNLPMIDATDDERRLGRCLTTEELDNLVKRQTEWN